MWKFAQAMVVGVNMYFIFIGCYSTIVAPHVSFAFIVMNLVGDQVTLFHPYVITRVIASLEFFFGCPWELIMIAVFFGSFAFVRVVG